MALVRYQPSSLLQQFNNEINRMFMRNTEDFPALSRGQWSPAVNVRETEDAYYIEAEVPGIEPKDIEVTLDKGVLRLAGERRDNNDEDDGSLRHVERFYGRFERRFTLPDSADGDNIEARAEQGVLKLAIRKKAASQPRRIEVQG
ncbi:MAG TPA: Hsp20/alpha crystallin family protein [Salinisphaeraceae bacterium]|nr:Hsp20/alpha crystallin family protein [Salinisphaeraceae bacterium]